MLFHGRGHGVEPVDRADEIVEGFSGGNVFDAKGKNGQAAADGAFDFFGDVAGGVGVGGKDQDHYFGDVDGFDDGFTVRAAGDVSRGAIQQRMPADSRRAQTASATTLSLEA